MKTALFPTRKKIVAAVLALLLVFSALGALFVVPTLAATTSYMDVRTTPGTYIKISMSSYSKDFDMYVGAPGHEKRFSEHKKTTVAGAVPSGKAYLVPAGQYTTRILMKSYDNVTATQLANGLTVNLIQGSLDGHHHFTTGNVSSYTDTTATIVNSETGIYQSSLINRFNFKIRYSTDPNFGDYFLTNDMEAIGTATIFTSGGSFRFDTTLTNLLPNTTYYYQAVADWYTLNDGIAGHYASGITYGDIKCFTTKAAQTPPCVITGDPINVTPTTATIINNAYSGITAKIMEVGTNYHLSPTMSGNPWRTGTIGTPFSTNLTGLTPDTTYYYQAYVNVPGGQYRGAIKSFKTPKQTVDCPVVKTGDPTNVSQNAATIINNTYSGISSAIAEVGNQYSVYLNMSNSFTATGSIGTPFSTNLSGLSPNTTYYYRAYVKAGSNYYYGEVKCFTTPAAAQPCVITGDPTNVTQTTATIVNNAYSNVTGTIYQVGNQYSTSATLASYTTQPAASIGTPFSTNLSGLSANTTYYYRAYVSTPSGYYYGQIKSFTTPVASQPCVITGDPTNVAQTTATIVNNTYSNVTSTIYQVGNQYSTSPTLASYTTQPAASIGTPFSTNLSGLSANTTYYYRAYVSTASGYYYGQIKSFTTAMPIAPKVFTGDPSNVSYTSANILNNTYTNMTGTIYMVGNEYSINPTLSSDTYSVIGAAGTPFSTSLTNLNSGTTYYYRAFVYTSTGVYYGEIKQFTTLTQAAPKVVTGEPTNVAQTTATIVNNTYANIPGTLYIIGNQYSTSPTLDSFASQSPSGIGTPFSVNLASLLPDTTYYYRAYVLSSTGYYYGEIKSFKTKAPDPKVTTGEPINVEKTTASIVLNSYSNIPGTITAVANRYGTSSSLTTYSTATAASITNPYGTSLSGLTPNTLYYYQAVVTSSAGTYLGEIKSFRTKDYNPQVITGDHSNVTQTTASILNNAYSDMPAPVTQVANQYGTSPTLATFSTVTTTITNPYSTNLAGLSPNTTYYYRAAVTVQSGSYTETFYGTIKQFTTPKPLPLVTTGDPQDVTYNAAKIVGNIYANIPGTITQVGNQYSTDPTLTTGTNNATGSIGTPYGTSLTGLLADTIYYYRAYVIADGITYYGLIKSFKTSVPPPVVKTGDPQNVTYNSATITNNTYTNIPGAINIVGNQYSVNSDLSGYAAQTGSIGSPYATNLSALQPDTLYYYRAYVISTAGTYFGEIKSFRTPKAPISVITGDPTNVTTKTATIVQNTYANIPGTITQVGNEYSLDSTLATGIQKATGTIGTPFSTSLSGLTPDTTYYYRAYVIADGVTYYGLIKQFKTLPIPTRDITAKIVWDDFTNAYGVRPLDVSIELSQNGKVIANAVVNVASNWQYTFTVPQYDEHEVAYVYTIDEAAVPEGYNKSVNNSTFTITNMLRVVKLTAIYYDSVAKQEIARETKYVPYNSNQVLTAPKLDFYVAQTPTSKVFMNLREEETFWTFNYKPV